MAEAVPKTNTAATAFNPASNVQSAHGRSLPGATHDLPSTDYENIEVFPGSSNASTHVEAFPDSSNASTQLEFGFDSTFNIKLDGDVTIEESPPGDESKQVRSVTGIRCILVVLSILSSTFLFALDNTVVADVQPKIVDRFGQIQKLPWLPIAFLVACVATNLIWYVDGYMLWFRLPTNKLDR